MDLDNTALIQPEVASDLSKKRNEKILDGLGQDLTKEPEDLSDNTSAEKPTKVQRTTGIFGVFSNIATGITSASHVVLEQAKEASKVVQKSLEEHTLIGGFNKMQNDFIQEKQSRERGPGVAPWIGSKNEDDLKKQILSISADKRNFVRDPPAGANFEFDLASIMPVASVLVEADPELDKRRFELVPKVVSETVFWRNYFYRISLIKQSSMLTADSPDSDERPRGLEDRDDISVASNLDLMDGSVVGDSDTHADEHQIILPCTPTPSTKSMSRGGTSDAGSDRGEDGWEQELQQTLDSYEVVPGDITETDLELERELGSDPVV